ncbi:MAG TPA: A24 family peptidase [Alphaproteobacteria bacterium]|nr:A24 family peptidase [Alphaproteobacteria bacterium]
MILIAFIIAFIALVIASITDLKKREVPDYISYGLMFTAFAISIIYSVVNYEYTYFAQALMGFVIGLIIAYSMFYLGQWGGGDSKLIMGLGAILGFNVFRMFGEYNFTLLILLANIILFGALYGLAWSIFLAIKKRKIFAKSLKIWLAKKEIIISRRIVLGLITIMFILTVTIMPQEYLIPLLSFIILFYFIFYVWLFVKVIEESCMIKDVLVKDLTEGDWIYKDVIIKGKKIVGPKDLGISREQIETLKKYSSKKMIKTVTIKEGIPFVPAFLIAFIATMIVHYTGILPF